MELAVSENFLHSTRYGLNPSYPVTALRTVLVKKRSLEVNQDKRLYYLTSSSSLVFNIKLNSSVFVFHRKKRDYGFHRRSQYRGWLI